jgi:hypothetical protein
MELVTSAAVKCMYQNEMMFKTVYKKSHKECSNWFINVACKEEKHH